MKIIFSNSYVFIFLLFCTSAHAEFLKNVYLDKENNIHLTTQQGQHRKITFKKNASTPKLAPDRQTVAWLGLNSWIAEGDDKPASEQLIIYRNGRSKSIKCDPFIRDFWFWNNGGQIVIDCGGRRFAGYEILYDTKTFKEIEKIDQATIPLEKRPAWANGDN